MKFRPGDTIRFIVRVDGQDIDLHQEPVNIVGITEDPDGGKTFRCRLESGHTFDLGLGVPLATPDIIKLAAQNPQDDVLSSLNARRPDDPTPNP